MEFVRKVLNKIEEALLILFLSLSVILSFMEVILRYGANRSLAWAEELIVIFMMWSAFLGLSYALKRRAHLRIDLLVERLPLKKKQYAQLVSDIIGGCFAFTLFSLSLRCGFEQYKGGLLSYTIDIPEYVYFLCFPLGFLFLGLRYIGLLITSIRGLKV